MTPLLRVCWTGFEDGSEIKLAQDSVQRWALVLGNLNIQGKPKDYFIIFYISLFGTGTP